jgi:hypothetical protein
MNNPQCCIYWKQIVSDDTYIYYVVLLGMNIRGLSFRRTPLLGLPGAEVIMGGGGGSLWQPRAVAFDGRYFYYSGSGTIQDTKTARLGVPQGDTLTLFTTALNGFVAGDGYLFFFEGDTLKSVPRDGGTPSTVVSDIGPVTSMIVANGTIYWSTGTDIKSVPVTGGPVTTRATMANGVAQRLVSDGTSLYVRVDAVSIVRFDLSTFASTTIVQNDVIADFAVDHESVYWVSTDPASGARMVKKTRK